MAIFEFTMEIIGVYGLFLVLVIMFWFTVTGILDRDLKQKTKELIIDIKALLLRPKSRISFKGRFFKSI